MNTPKEYYTTITSIDIAEVARELLGDRITGESGNEISIDCPRHVSQSKRSFQVNREKQRWKCFGCDQGGDVLHLVEFVQSGVVTKGASGAMPDSHRAARDWLAKKAGLPSLSEYNLPPEQVAEIEARRAEEELVHSILTDIAGFYHKKFLDNETALNVFSKQYGIAAETIKSLKIGYADNNGLLAWLKDKRGHAPSNIVKTGCFSIDSQDNLFPFFDKRFTFPYLKQGKVVYITGRATQWTDNTKYERGKKYKKLPVRSDQRKYISRCIKNSYFYNEDSLLAGHDFTIITEGVTDCISLMEHGFPTMSPATLAFRDRDHDKLIASLARLKNIYICHDNEISGAGLKGALSTARFLAEKGLAAEIIELPLFDDQMEARKTLAEKFGIHEGIGPDEINKKIAALSPKDRNAVEKLRDTEKQDVNKYFQRKTATEFKKLMEVAKSPIRIEIEAIDPDIDEKERITALKPILRRIGALDPLERDYYVNVIHSHFQKKIPKKTILDAVKAADRDNKSSGRKFHSDAPDGSCLQLVERLIFETTEEEGSPNWHTITDGIYNWFVEHGACFFHDPQGRQYFYFENTIYRMIPSPVTNRKYLSLIYKHTRLDSVSQSGRRFFDIFSNLALERGELKEMFNWIHTDITNQTVFFNLNNEANEILKITPEDITVINNGNNPDNIILANSAKIRPIAYLPDVNIADGEALIKSHLFDNLTCAEPERWLLINWLFCFLLLDFAGTKPMARFEGHHASGKSTASKLISTLIYGAPQQKRSTIAANYTDGAVNPIVLLDNIETKNATDDLIDFLLTSVTGIGNEKRKMGTDNENVIEFTKCLINTSGIEPLAGAMSEVVSRTLLFNFNLSNSSQDFFLDVDAIETLRRDRDVILSTVFKKTRIVLNLIRDGAQRRVMQLLHDTVGGHSKMRCNDFLSLIYLMMIADEDRAAVEGGLAALNPTFVAMINSQQRFSDEIEMESNPIIIGLYGLFREYHLAKLADEHIVNGNDRVNVDNYFKTYHLKFSDDYTIDGVLAKELHIALKKFSAVKGLQYDYKSTMQFIQRFRNNMKIIRQAGFEVEVNEHERHNKKSYTITISPEFISRNKSVMQKDAHFEDSNGELWE